MDEPPAEDGASSADAADGWAAVVGDMAATAAQYRDRGWTAIELHPADSGLVDTDSRRGIDVVLSGPEFAELEGAVAEGTFRDVEVFAAADGGVVYLLVVEADRRNETAVLLPVSYDPAAGAGTLEAIDESGSIRLYCRRASDDTVTFVHDDPAPFLPQRS